VSAAGKSKSRPGGGARWFDATIEAIGNRVHGVVALDTEERLVTLPEPEELVLTLGTNRAVAERFERLAYTHRKEFARWVAEGKKQETRDRRAERAIEMTLEGASL